MRSILSTKTINASRHGTVGFGVYFNNLTDPNTNREAVLSNNYGSLGGFFRGKYVEAVFLFILPFKKLKKKEYQKQWFPTWKPWNYRKLIKVQHGGSDVYVW